MKKHIIKLEKVWKTYTLGGEQVHALRGVNLAISQNQFIVIEGPSGSGKSTMMNLVGCLDIPSQGEIYLDTKNIAHLAESDLATIRGKKIGFVFQKFNLIPTLTALQNVALPALFQRKSDKERYAKAKELLTFVDLGHRLHHKPNQLSGGEQQRVAIARSLINDPEVILADEPTGNLDTATGKKIMELFKKLHKQGKTIITVTHNPKLEEYAERIIKIQDGILTEAKK